MKKVMVALLMMSGFVFAKGCWDLKASSSLEFDELKDSITFSVKNAVDCKVISGASINFNGVKLKTNAKGEFNVPLDVLKEGQKVKVLVKRSGFISLLKKVHVEAGSIWENKILLSPLMPEHSARFVLTWNEKPEDLDLHLKSEDFHISYQNKRSVTDKASLDRDGRKGFGPETITLLDIKPDENYDLYVHRYSSEGQIDNRAKVEVYIENKYKGTIALGATKERIVHVLSLDKKGYKKINKPISDYR